MSIRVSSSPGRVRCPVSIRFFPPSWAVVSWEQERMIANLSAMRACRGRISPIRIPATLVEMALQGPRYSAGASGFGS